MRLSILIIFSSILFYECSLSGSFKGLYSYYESAKRANPNLFVEFDPDNILCEAKNSSVPRVYISNGVELRKCAFNINDAVFYIWSPRCKGEFCYSINTLQKKCDAKNIELFVIAEYYDIELMQTNYAIEKPVFAVDTKYYKTDLTSNYRARFVFDLTGGSNCTGRFIYLKNGLLIKSFNSIDLL